jgi:glutathione reductase (NADPH)
MGLPGSPFASLTVEGRELKTRYFLIAAGARPVSPGIPGEHNIVNSDRFLELDALPAHIVLVGGYIAAEFSHIAARAGARVTVL